MSIAYRPFVALMKRELWEHRAFWVVPAVISCCLTLMVLYHLTIGGVLVDVGAERVALRLDEIGALTYAEQTNLFSAAFLGVSAVFAIGMGFALAFYLLDALYTDRKDRSFLFWKSMPVSDTSTVLSKLATVTITAPLISLAVIATSVLVWVGIFSMVGLWSGSGNWWVAMNPLAWLEFILTALAGIVVWSMILMPFIGWLLLVSAWAKRAPFLWAVLPPLGVAWIEEFTFDTNHFVGMIVGHFDHLAHRAFDVAGRAMQVGGGEDSVRMRLSTVEITVDPAILLEPRLWIGLAVGAAFIHATILVRRYRDDA